MDDHRAELVNSVAQQSESLYEAVKALAQHEQAAHPGTPYATTWDEVQQRVFDVKTVLVGMLGGIVMGAERT